MKPGRTSPQLIRSSSGESPDQGYLPNKIRMVQLKRRGTAPLGFSIRGGREHGTGVFVSQVSGGSEAHHKGLRVGDQIIRINGYPIDHFIHEEVLALLKAKPNIVLKVKSVGMIPIKDNKRDPITWKMVEPDPCSSGSDGTHSVSSGSSLDEFVETKVFISGIGGSSLGCSVVKGPPELPGIFVQTVKPHGLAEIAGLEIGDQITEVNGQGFVNVEFSEAIAMLKSFKEMALTVRKGAGLELFPEERLRRINARLCNRSAKGRSNGHTTNGNHTIRNRTLYTNGTNGKGSPESFHDTLTNGSLSEMSDRSTSLSSSQSTSPVTNGHTNGTNGLVEYGQKLRSSENGTHHHHHHLYGTNGQHLLLVPKLSLVGAEERQRIEEEKRRLLEKEQLLQLEAEKLAEERRQLEAQKQLQQQQQLQQEHQQQQQQHPRPATMPAAPPAPPQMHVFAELHSVAQQRRLLREKAAQNGDALAARKPGGIRPGLRPDAKPSPDVLIKQKQHEQLMVEFREVHKKMFGATNAVVAPSERSGSQQSQVDADLRKSAALINAQETSKKERPIARAAHVVKGPAPKPPAPVSAGAAKDVPITDSRGPEAKPPKSFFSGKPLVTIGSYPDGSNPRPNRFARPANVEIIDADKGTTTVDSSGKSSGVRTPSPGRTQSPDGPKMTVSINCKAPNRPSLSTRFTTNASPTQPALANLANDVTEGAVVKTLTFKKDGPLNLILDGGLNSAHDGRIVVAEVREGGMIPVDGEISAGDQILMVDNTRLVNTTLTAARVAIQNAMASADNDLRLTIAKMP
ncbi:whirlin isoform X3 [Rhipicephalus sanguineus]|uniref:whirlin isoform X3 n=1 Tax=Rhipicephalus sanguineus TaxID=34632 RepID=UPI001895128C|nr:whirlin isoform X3 [Rhipicephalus sanguineus]